MGTVALARSFARKVRKSLRRRGLLGTVTTTLAYVKYHAHQLTPAGRQARQRDTDFDREFGVDTAGIVELSVLDVDSPSYESGHRYQATTPGVFRQMIAELDIPYANYVFIDIGSGKGRALLLASEFPFKRIIGVEFAPQLHEVAQRNISVFKNPAQKCKQLASVCTDAALYAFPVEPSVLYFYHPFEEDVMVRVLSNIRQSFEVHPRDMFVVYQNPLYSGLLKKHEFLTLLKTGPDYEIYKVVGRPHYH